MDTIDQISKRNKDLPIDIDFMGNRYKTTNGYFTFTSPSLWALEKNLYYLLRHSEKRDFESKYIMRPDYLSWDEYNTVVLAPFLMYVNGVMSIEEFNLNEVIIPKFSAIIKVTEDKFSKTASEEIDW
jgi:hypothetical protein